MDCSRRAVAGTKNDPSIPAPAGNPVKSGESPEGVRRGGPTGCTDAPPAGAVTRRLTATARLLRRVPAALRPRLPPRRIPRAVERLGPDTRPDPYTLSEAASILDGPGSGHGSDGGDGTRWGRAD
ncbi:hypothetical protein GCM10010305_41470 [Streptomyces termitum]|uniref:Uncharacterized protein n=1 Tax=Streptomyces termitum TaxID=67368 RepID=A0A918W9Y5_9ACTN|nr:hypothetical protein GCM10010305_41470 [Streptomyces termitum]